MKQMIYFCEQINSMACSASIKGVNKVTVNFAIPTVSVIVTMDTLAVDVASQHFQQVSLNGLSSKQVTIFK